MLHVDTMKSCLEDVCIPLSHYAAVSGRAKGVNSSSETLGHLESGCMFYFVSLCSLLTCHDLRRFYNVSLLMPLSKIRKM